MILFIGNYTGLDIYEKGNQWQMANKTAHKKALHWTAIPLRSIAAHELRRSCTEQSPASLAGMKISSAQNQPSVPSA